MTSVNSVGGVEWFGWSTLEWMEKSKVVGAEGVGSTVGWTEYSWWCAKWVGGVKWGRAG